MFSLETSLGRILFAVLVQIVCLMTAIFGVICSGERDKWSGIIKFVSCLAVSCVWLITGAASLPYFGFNRSLLWLAAYTAWGALGVVPFVFSLFKAWKKGETAVWKETVWGVMTVLLFCGSLSVLLYYECVAEAVPFADKLFHEKCLEVIFLCLIPPVSLFFTPAFSISALVLGALRKKLSGFLKNLLLLAAAPGAFLAFTVTVARQLDKIHSGQPDNILTMLAAAVSWLAFMFLPYGFMLLRGKKEKDKMKFCNGIAGLGAVNSFMLGLFLLAYICRNR